LEIKIGIRYMENAMTEDMSDVKKEYNWKYGYRVLDSRTKSLSKFFEFPKFDKEVYSSTNDFFKFFTIDKNGGTTIPNVSLYSVRQWSSPRNGTVSVTIDSKGKGNTLTIYKNSTALKVVTLASTNSTIELPNQEVFVNDKFEFAVNHGEMTQGSKNYTLNVRINEIKDVNSLTPIMWNSTSDYRGPLRKSDRELNSWERYAHILLLSNEMVFVN